MYKNFIFLIFLILSGELYANESLLTLKQQLDRLQREVSDLSQSVFKSSRDDSLKSIKDENEPINLSAFDLRIYDLEKDIQKLNENFEEIIFEIDDLKKLYEKLSKDVSSNKLIQNELSNENIITESSEESFEITTKSLDDSLENKENILGTLVINNTTKTNEIIKEDLASEDSNDNIDNLADVKQYSPEEEFQIAFDFIRNQNFKAAKNALKDFIKKYQDDKLSGSAHYWLGEIYILNKEYREAALTMAEGYQKFPSSYKAPDMLFKLSEALVNINKVSDACGTLTKLIKEFPNHKLAIKAKNKIISLTCDNLKE